MPRPAIEPVTWRVARNGWGQPAIVDPFGVPIHRNPDPVIALENCYLACAAPLLRQAVAPLIQRLERIEVDHGIPIMARDAVRIALAWEALHLVTPPAHEIDRAAAGRVQKEFDWAEDVA